jgi:hypothetical protein
MSIHMEERVRILQRNMIWSVMLSLAICLPTLSSDPAPPVEPAYPAPPALTTSPELLMAQVPPPPVSGEEAVKRCEGKGEKALAKTFMKQDIQDQIGILDRYLSNDFLTSSLRESMKSFDDSDKQTMMALMKGVRGAIYAGSQEIEPLRKQLSEAAGRLKATAQRLQQDRDAAEKKEDAKNPERAKAIQAEWEKGLKTAVANYLTDTGKIWVDYNTALSKQLDSVMTETQQALKSSNTAVIVQAAYSMQRDGYHALLTYANTSQEICENAASLYRQLPVPPKEEPPKKGK